jgi:hypothetical protein
MYPEPWYFNGEEIRAANGKVVCQVEPYTAPEFSLPPMHRAVACVNALAGIADPVAFMASVERLVEAGTAFTHRRFPLDGEWAEFFSALAAVSDTIPAKKGS